MIQSEAQLEQQFLEKLQEMKCTYRSDIRGLTRSRRISHAISDNYVLRFKVEYYGNKELDGQEAAKPSPRTRLWGISSIIPKVWGRISGCVGNILRNRGV